MHPCYLCPCVCVQRTNCFGPFVTHTAHADAPWGIATFSLCTGRQLLFCLPAISCLVGELNWIESAKLNVKSYLQIETIIIINFSKRRWNAGQLFRGIGEGQYQFLSKVVSFLLTHLLQGVIFLFTIYFMSDYLLSYFSSASNHGGIWAQHFLLQCDDEQKSCRADAFNWQMGKLICLACLFATKLCRMQILFLS